jgi:signal transduction histidine kinase
MTNKPPKLKNNDYKKLYKQLMAEVLTKQSETQAFIQALIKNQEDEKKEISRELHDEIAQMLTGINFDLVSMGKESIVTQEKLRIRIEKTQKNLIKSVESISLFAKELRPMILDDLGLIEAIKSLIKDIKERSNIEIIFRYSELCNQLNDFEKTVFFRIAQEALTNIERHANATNVHITISITKKTIMLEIQDNGKSFNPDQALFNGTTNKGTGIIGMRERVKIIGGEFKILSLPDKGTLVVASIPFTKDNLS